MDVRIQGHRVAIPVTIRSISCEGCGVQFRSGRTRLMRGTQVTVRFGGRRLGRFELPGRVAWTARDGAGARRRFDLGVRFQLELAQLDMRQSYARWIVGLIQSAASP